MIVGYIIGTATTTSFKFRVKKEIKKFDYVKVYNEIGKYCLCQVVELERDNEKTIATCNVIGYNENKKIKIPRLPFKPNTEVLVADDEFIRDTIEISNNGLLIGKLENTNVNVRIDPKKIMTRHLAILAKTGAGKSYIAGVIVEELIKKGYPILIIDPHGEYSTLKEPNEEEKQELLRYNLKPKGFPIVEYGNSYLNDCIQLKLKDRFLPEEFIDLLPIKLTPSQKILLYNIIKDLDEISLKKVLTALAYENTSSKIPLISQIKYLINTNLFDDFGLSYNEMIKPKQCTIINLKGYSNEIQQLIVYKILTDLFNLRKISKVPPFFLLIEESHNFCPERTFGEVKSSRIIRDIASEGRKFGIGLCIISQRPAKVDKNVLSQCNVQIILKITNPNDLKAILQSVEGITLETYNEIKNLTTGTCLISGMFEQPIFVNVRPRQSKHGGKDYLLEKELENNDVEYIIEPRISLKDFLIINGSAKIISIPGLYITVEKDDKEYNLLFELFNGYIVSDIDSKIYHKNLKENIEEIATYYTLNKKKIEVDMHLDPKIDEKIIINKLKSFYNDIKIKRVVNCNIIMYVKDKKSNKA